MAGPLILTAAFAQPDFAWLEGLRRQHYPSDRNQVPAHLTIFHALPPSLEGEARRRLAQMAEGPPPRALIAGLMDLGGGVAFRIASEDLETIREELADAFQGMLGRNDAMGWRPHVTIQNKVTQSVARNLKTALELGFEPRSLGIAGLALQRYLGGPWEHLASYAFRGA